MEEIIEAIAIELWKSTNDYDNSVTKDNFYWNIKKQRTLNWMLDEILELQELENNFIKTSLWGLK